MSKYFRVTAYHPVRDICGIFDSNGHFEKLWMLSSELIKKGFKIIAVSEKDKFDYGDFPACEVDKKHILLRASGYGQPIIDANTVTVNDLSYTFEE